MPDIESNEEEMLGRASRGDREAFGGLYERYVERIYNYVYYRTGNLHDAEDLTARVFQRAMNHIHSYTDRGVPFSAWLYRIAHNLVANWHRDRSRKQEIPLSDLPVVISKEERPEARLVRTLETMGDHDVYVFEILHATMRRDEAILELRDTKLSYGG